MNSSPFVLANANYAALEERVLSCSTPSEFILQNTQRGRWKSSGLTSLQNLPRGATPEHTALTAAFSECITGLSAQFVIMDELPAQINNDIFDAFCGIRTVPTKEERTMHATNTTIKVNTNALSMTWVDKGYQEGDVYTLTRGVNPDELGAQIGYHLGAGRNGPANHVIMNILRVLYYSYMGPEIQLYPISNWRVRDLSFYDISANGSNVVVYGNYQDNHITAVSMGGLVENGRDLIEELFNLKLHKDTIAFAKELFSDAENIVSVSRGDVHLSFDGTDCKVPTHQLLPLLMNLNAVFANRGAVVVGEGFKGGNPMLVLAKPVFRDGVLQELQLQEQRTGRFLQTLYGDAYDFRAKIDDLKVYNKAPNSYLCKTEQEWYDAYKHGPSSCMTGFVFEESPVRCYAVTSHGLPDNNLRLCINYVGELFGAGFQALNRAIVNVESKQFVRAYGSNGAAIMRSLGYEHNACATDGCALAKIPHPNHTGAYLMPYLDGSADNVDDQGGYWEIVNYGDHGATEADGYIYVEGRCTCNHCDNDFHEDDMIDTAEDGLICEECANEYYTTPVGRDGLYFLGDCVYSEHLYEYVLEPDAFECPVYGWVHEDDTRTVQGISVHDDATEYHDGLGDYILTEEAAAALEMPYLGNEDETEDEQEEAA